jgi:hypothetical protein
LQLNPNNPERIADNNFVRGQPQPAADKELPHHYGCDRKDRKAKNKVKTATVDEADHADHRHEAHEDNPENTEHTQRETRTPGDGRLDHTSSIDAESDATPEQEPGQLTLPALDAADQPHPVLLRLARMTVATVATSAKQPELRIGELERQAEDVFDHSQGGGADDGQAARRVADALAERAVAAPK